MKKKSVFFLAFWIMAPWCALSFGAELHWSYNRHFHDQLVGYRVYTGTSPETVNQLILDIKKENVTVFSEQPILFRESFNTDPAARLTPSQGSWKWIASSKNMKVDAGSFMLSIQKAIGSNGQLSFTLWPEKSSGDQARFLSYIKDEAMPGYYELRLGSSSGTRFSNWRKVYDGRYNGIDPGGALGLPSYPQCQILVNQDSICEGFRVFMNWTPAQYAVGVQAIDKNSSMAIVNAFAKGADSDQRALNINKVEILSESQSFWIDDIIVGGQIDIGCTISTALTDKIYIAASAYRFAPGSTSQILESEKSIPVQYVLTPEEPEKRKPLPVKQIRRVPQ